MTKSILVDMDDVITCGNFQRFITEFLGERPDFDNFKGFYLQDLLGDRKAEFFEWFKDQNLYAEAKLEPGCYDALKALNDHYKIHICTAYIWREMPESSGRCLKDKFDFLCHELDFLDPNDFIFTTAKTVINADVRIDDKISNLANAQTKLLYSAWHNTDLAPAELATEGIIRVDNWSEIQDYLLK